MIAYRTDTQQESNLDFTVDFIVNVDDEDNLLEDGELAEITVDASGSGWQLMR